MKRRLVYIEWEDSHERFGWTTPIRILMDNMLCVTVGWIMGEDEDRIVVASSISVVNGPDEPLTSGTTAIPKVCIKRMVGIKLPSRLKLPPHLTK